MTSALQEVTAAPSGGRTNDRQGEPRQQRRGEGRSGRGGVDDDLLHHILMGLYYHFIYIYWTAFEEGYIAYICVL